MLHWFLIFSITLVSTTLMMTLGMYLAILPESSLYFSVSRTKLLIFSTCFNISYILIGPLVFRLPERPTIKLSCLLICIGSLGRWLAGSNYTMAISMTLLMALAHIAIINAPYSCLKLFSYHQRGYASSIALVVPTLGINVCIFYGMYYVVGSSEPAANISWLNGVTAVVGTLSTASTIILMQLLENKLVSLEVETEEDKGNVLQQNSSLQSNTQQGNSIMLQTAVNPSGTICQRIANYITFDKIRIWAWGSTVGISWSYGTLFAILFGELSLTSKQIAMIGLSANISSIVFSNFGSFLHSKVSISIRLLIQCMISVGVVSAMLILFFQFVKFSPQVMVVVSSGLIVLLRAGFASFVPLSFLQMQRFNPENNNSGEFFFVANVVDFSLLVLIDLLPVKVGLTILTLVALTCLLVFRHTYVVEDRKSIQINNPPSHTQLHTATTH